MKKKACRKERTVTKSTEQKAQANACRRIRLHPNRQDIRTLSKWFGAVRKTYNWALGHIKNNKVPSHKISDPYWMVNRFVTSCNIPPSLAYLHESTPKHVREGAIRDLVLAYKTNWAKWKKNPGHRFDIKYRSKKAGDQAIVIPSVAVDLMRSGIAKIYPTFLTGIIHYNTQSWTGDVRSDCRLEKDALGHFYLCIPYVRACDNQAGGAGWVALDPGVRTLLTGWSPDGRAFQVAPADVSRIYRLCSWLDKLNAKHSQAKGRHKQQMQKAIVRARLRIRHIVDEVHCKTAHYLCSRYSDILLPEFQTQNMVKDRRVRRIGSKTARAMLTWAHYRLKQRLIQKCASVGVRVHICTEEYTSKTCTCCGRIKNNLGGAKIYRCDCCHSMIDRDLNGARNIFLKNVRSRAAVPGVASLGLQL